MMSGFDADLEALATAAGSARIKRSQLRRWPNGACSWIEQRPASGRRSILVVDDGTGPRDWGDPTWSMSSSINTYGGWSYAPRPEGGVVFVDSSTGQLFEASDARSARPVTSSEAYRYGDLVVSPSWLVAVREPTEGPGSELVAIRRSTGELTVLVAGHDFISSPALSPDERTIAWVSWDHPELGFDHAAISCGALGPDGSLLEVTHLAGGGGVAAHSPQFSTSGRLWCMCDATGFFVPTVLDETGAHPMVHDASDYAEPLWSSLRRTMLVVDDDEVVVVRRHGGVDQLGRLEGQRFVPVGASTLITIEDLTRGPAGAVTVLAATTTTRLEVHEVVLAAATQPAEVRTAPRGPQPFVVTTRDGVEVSGFFTPPLEGSGGPSPVVVQCHGGPSSSVDPSYDPMVHYLTALGLGVAQLNYRGSTGFGRDFRRALYGRWGVVDVADVEDFALGLVAAGLALPDRLGVRGSSAGGFTALRAARGSIFACATSLYGVTDLGRLAASSVGIEQHYLDLLIGDPTTDGHLYEERSPALHPEELTTPLLVLQGADDPIVPRAQAEALVAAVSARGGLVDLVVFEGEGHGFRNLDTITSVLRHERAFYAQYLGSR